ncbi:putative copper resistance protein D [Yersinia enterocolitica]|uniref:Copper resistance protein D n=1 Tax=Yersinia enterocolitica serotype O:8 / biotype 1B (strain NCTC 13174 / 8081) TaxID=393305 RepID=A1JLN1_YERE8|nr:copper homeostasis membrane protein CopD [Yersinia enterocolitica]AJI82185.1 copper resistance D family protein [Yersinia enterocolitica]AJJ23939.1 copper resistance D family protein [Yersinia enterocolitica]EKA27583.1 copper resistance protein D [Yersinia enterocolitica subsp. enterocolitica WA-314]ELI8285060.1 copper homeostasis membrane protein CopD [Yersinia enterocolitica]KGA71582.1 copper resistance D family protein [Yersinia enterocolitica]
MSLATLFVLCRFLHFLAVMLMFGISIFTAVLAPDRFSSILKNRLSPLLIFSTFLGLASAIGLLAIQAGMMGDGWSDTYRLSVWWAVLGTRFGEIWQWHLGLSILSMWVVLLGTTRFYYQLMVACSTLLLASLAFTGHAAMHDGVLGWVHQTNQIIHLLSAGYWLGCLPVLLVCLAYTRRDDVKREAITTLIRFSSWGHLAVALVLVTGMINSIIILRETSLALTSVYQMLLLSKAILVLFMVVVAIINRYLIVPMLRKLPVKAHYWLVVNSCAEIVLGAAVLLLVSIFATMAPV